MTRPYFLCTGRLEYYKGFQDVIPLFRDLSDQASLIICGQGAYERELQSLAEGMANVHFTGALSRNQLQILYENAVATIVPTLAYQTFCHTTARVFLRRNTGHRPQAWSRRGNNHATRWGNSLHTAGRTASAIAKMIGDDRTRLELGRQALAAHGLEFSEDVYLRRYLDIVAELSPKKPPAEAFARTKRAP